MELNPDTNYCNTILSIEEDNTDNNQFAVYPNPATSDITFDFSSATKIPGIN